MDKVEAYAKLARLKELDIDVTKPIKRVAESVDVPEDVVRFIESNSQPEARKFFENLRALHNEKNHQLYKNIMSESLGEVDKLKCLSSYLTNACIAMESMENPSRLVELRTSIGLEIVSEALYCYYNGKDYGKIDEALSYIKNLVKKFE